ncbi:MAG: hypothetical protein WD595_04170 [Waddliaceae bacterium]
MDELLKVLLEEQKRHLLKLGRKLIPTLTPDDILQPNDYPELENHPVFRYEEGILAGIQSVKAAYLAMKAEEESNSPENL